MLSGVEMSRPCQTLHNAEMCEQNKCHHCFKPLPFRGFHSAARDNWHTGGTNPVHRELFALGWLDLIFFYLNYKSFCWIIILVLSCI